VKLRSKLRKPKPKKKERSRRTKGGGDQSAVKLWQTNARLHLEEKKVDDQQKRKGCLGFSNQCGATRYHFCLALVRNLKKKSRKTLDFKRTKDRKKAPRGGPATITRWRKRSDGLRVDQWFGRTFPKENASRQPIVKGKVEVGEVVTTGVALATL
jgi:hypothetical protein